MSTTYVIQPPEIPALPVQGDSKRFAVNRIYCVGRNYADHAREMGHDPDREPPFFFMKPATAIVTDGKNMAYPSLSNDVHHEIEMVVALGKGGANIPADQALDHVWGYGVGLDMTRRDLQGEAKKMGRPWDTGKAFDQSAPCSALVPVSQCGPCKRTNPFKGERTDKARWRSSNDDLERTRYDCLPIHAIYFDAWRLNIFRNPSRCCRGSAGRCSGRPR